MGIEPHLALVSWGEGYYVVSQICFGMVAASEEVAAGLKADLLESKQQVCWPHDALHYCA